MPTSYKLEIEGQTINTPIPEQRVLKGSPPKVARYELEPALQNIFLGLPYGLTIIYGAAKVGKSKFVKYIHETVADNEKSLFVLSDSYSDMPKINSCTTLNYGKYLPNWKKAISEVFAYANEYQPNLISIDSGTKFLAGTNTRVEESDVRGGLFDIARASDRVVPIVVTSEIRGSGTFTYPAGGQAVAHACILLIRMERREIDTTWLSKKYGEPEGAVVYTLHVEGDRDGLARVNREMRVTYSEDGGHISLTPIEYYEALKKKEGEK